MIFGESVFRAIKKQKAIAAPTADLPAYRWKKLPVGIFATIATKDFLAQK